MSKTLAEVLTPSDYDRLNALLGTRKMSVKALEAGAGLGSSTISTGARRGTAMTLDTAVACARFLGASIGDIIGQERAAELGFATDAQALKIGPVDRLGEYPDRVALLDIELSKLNPRKTITAEEIAELAENIAAQGLLQNLVVRPNPDYFDVTDGHFLLMAGERRLRALLKLADEGRLPDEIATLGVPVKVREATEAEHLAIALLENLARRDMNPMEEANGFAQLHALDPKLYSTEWIAGQTGFTQRYVQQRLKLTTALTDETQAALMSGKITLAAAKVLTIAPAKRQKDLIKSGAAVNYKAEDLKKQITNQWVRCSYARFDWTAPELAEYVVVDEGTEWFKDRKKFDELQALAVDRLLLEAKANFAWAEKGYFNDWDYEKDRVSPPARGGCFFEVHYYGAVRIHEGLIKKREDDHISADEERRRAELAALNEERFAAYETLETQLRAALTSRDVIMLMVMNALAPGYDQKPLEGSMRMTTDALAGPLKRVAGSVAKQQAYPQTLAFKDNVDLGTAWTVLSGLTDIELEAALVEMLLPTVRLSKHQGVHAAYLGIARRHGIDIPAVAIMGEDEKQAELQRRMAVPAAQTDLEDAIAEQDAA